MDSKCILLALVVVFTQELVYSHILPSSDADFRIADCARSLNRYMNNVCTSYGDYADLFSETDMPLIPKEDPSIRRWEMRQKIIRTCCIRPCSASELYAYC